MQKVGGPVSKNKHTNGDSALKECQRMALELKAISEFPRGRLETFITTESSSTITTKKNKHPIQCPENN